MPVALQRFWIQLTADRRKFGMLCAALAVGLLLWARIIILSNVPRTAIAEEEQSANAAASDNSYSAGYRTGQRRSQSRGPSEAKPFALDSQPSRDPFIISPIHFPKPTGSAINGRLAGDQSKFGSQPADDAEQAAARRVATLRSLVSGFRLDAVMSGAGIAVINGRTVRLGETVPAVENEEIQFELIEVKQRSAMLRFEELVFEVHMPSPGR